MPFVVRFFGSRVNKGLRDRNSHGAAGELLAFRHVLANLNFGLDLIEIGVSPDRVLALNLEPDVVLLHPEFDRIAHGQTHCRFLRRFSEVRHIANPYHIAKTGACICQFEQFSALVLVLVAREAKR